MATGKPQDIFKTRPREYRKFLRFPLALKAKCHYSVDGLSESCRIVDISSKGLGFELDDPVQMHDGQFVLLKIALAPQDPPVSAITELAWVRRRENGSVSQRAGSRLLFIDPAAKQRLLDRAYATVISDINETGPA